MTSSSASAEYLLFDAAEGWYPLRYLRTVAFSPITLSVNDLFTVTGLPDDLLSAAADDADALGVMAALLVSLGAGADVVCDGEVVLSDELPESSLHAVSSALPTTIAATTG